MKVIFEDDYILVIDKPNGEVVNRSSTHLGSTVQDFVESQVDFDAADSDEESEFRSRSGIVHRLDKETSGILLIAKTPEAFVNIQRQFKERTVEKEYRAVVLGHLANTKFEVNAPLGRNPNKPLSIAVVQTGKDAQTGFELIKNFEVEQTKYAYLKAFPRTGRTHQIRVHLAAIKNPVAGDPIYCSSRQYIETRKAFARMMLHALSLNITHPETKKPIKFLSELPEDFSKYI